MGSESRNKNGDGSEQVAAAHGVPATAKKVVQSVKEIVNCTEQEIYTVLKECEMDPNRAVERLLSQDTFREVRSKRERRKEMKEAFDSRTRVNNVGLSRGGKTGTASDRSVGHSGLSRVTYNEHGKAIDKREGGSMCPSVTSSATHVVGKSTKGDCFSTDDGRQSLRTGDSMSDSAQASAGPQPLMIGVNKGHLSMADIVRMGRTSQNAVSHNPCNNTSGVSASGNSESSLSLYCQNHPVIEQPKLIARNSQALNMSASSNANEPFEHPSLDVSAVRLGKNFELDAVQGSGGNVAWDNVISEKNESAISSKSTILSSDTGLRSHSNSNLKNDVSPDLHSSYEHCEDVSSAASIFQRLSIGECKQKVSAFKDDHTVVIPNHLQALGVDCSHLSFGTYNGGSSSASSAILASNNVSKSGLEEKFSAVDDSLAQFLDTSSGYHDDEQLGFDVLRGTSGDKCRDQLSSQQEFVRHIVPEETLEHEYSITASVSDPSLLKSQWVNRSLPLKQPGLQSGNCSTFTREEMQYADSNSIPGDVFAYLMSQSQPARHSNSVSSISNPAISMSEVMEPGAFALPKRSVFPQDLTLQSSVHSQQLPDMNGYHSLPQNQSYVMNINSHQAFSGNPAYNQSPADMKYNLPQNRLSSATVRDASGYGNPGSSFHSPGSSLSNPSLGYMMPSSNLNEILRSQYNDGHNLISIQQRGSFSHWDYGAESRSSFLPERTQSNFLGQPNQASLPQYASPGYSDLNHSQKQILEELQQPGGFQDLSSKQLHQFWQHGH